MTIRELVEWAGHNTIPLIAVLTAPPLLALLAGWAHGRGKGENAPWKYIYSVLVYAVCLPGNFAAVLTGYALFFTNENLLDANVLVYILPIASMVATLFLIRQNVDFARVPGFDRLSGLMVMIGIAFALALAVQRSRIWLVFGGSVQTVFLLALGLFALLKWGAYTFFRRREEPKVKPPSLRFG